MEGHVNTSTEHEIQRITEGTTLRRKDMTREERLAHDAATAARRMRAQRKRQRTEAIEVEKAAKPLDARRMRYSLHACSLIFELITKVVKSRYDKVSRVLGDVMVEDIASDVVIGTAEGLTRSEHRIESLLIAADWLSRQPGIPEVPVEAPVGAKFIMSVLMRQTKIQITNAYRANTVTISTRDLVQDPDTGIWTEQVVTRDATLESLEYLDTILSNQYMGGIDTLIAQSKASAPPSMTGTKMQIPGTPNRVFARMIIDAGLSARGLDWLTDFILDDDNRRSDGAIKWSERSGDIFEHLLKADPNRFDDKKRATIAREATRTAYAFYQDLIISAYALASDPALLDEITKGQHHPTAGIIAATVGKLETEERVLAWRTRHGAYNYKSVATLEEVVELLDDPKKMARAKALLAAQIMEELLEA